MAEAELREEVGYIPYQEDKKVREALQYYILKMENDIQNTGVNDIATVIDYQPQSAIPDMSHLSPEIQEYILSVSTGLQSTIPSDGLFNMLAPLNIDRNNIDNLRDGTMKINMEDALKFQQQIRDGMGLQ
ncbi:hypothetical protein GWI33_010942 [Rhynchophorus ferrugineus]|uniref:Uncharacterized protein n=1 Tax=Rhynchophorus ferrugineus TaxID=354439 RepID=A0A834I7U8_RHYFE|nr:hypothetical protein GWI33_010941 [Rhynchophorus ferrugineus]KAF7276081.1 hypothetical protein GWI33_010942 [Rhynchophorus ferrugineus]